MTEQLTALVIGDPHFKVDNIPEVELFIEKIEKLALEKRPDIIISLGDLLHTHERLHTVALNKAQEFIERMSKIAKTYSIVGNHDLISHNAFLSENHWMNGMKKWNNVVVVDKVVCDTIKGCKIVLCPYVNPGKFEESLNTIGDEWKDSTCIFAHQEFFGCKMGAIISEEGDKWPLEYPNVVSGHIHSRQIIQPNIYYTGSAMQHAFGESETNIIAFLTFSNGEKDYIREEIDLNLPRKKIIYKEICEMEDFEIPETDDKIKISLSGTYEEFKSFKKTNTYKNACKSVDKVIFKPTKIEMKNVKKEDVDENELDFEKNLFKLLADDKNLLNVYTYIQGMK